MKKMKKKIFIPLIILMICYSSIGTLFVQGNSENKELTVILFQPLSNQHTQNSINRSPYTMEINSFEPHSPIRIIGEDKFSRQNGVTAGDGTKDHPYIIEHWDIEGTPLWIFLNTLLYRLERSNFDNKWEYFVNIPICGIYLKDTAKHVIIRNNHVYNWKGKTRELLQIAGVTLINASNVTIEQNNFENNYRGVNIENVQVIIKKIDNSTCKIYQSYNSVFLTIKNNTFTASENEGLFLDFVNKSTVEGNYFTENAFGIRSNFCNVLITNNTFFSNNNGIICTQYDFSTITYNNFTFNGNGVYCAESTSDPIGSSPMIAYNHFEENLAAIHICTNYPRIVHNSFYGNFYGIMNMGFSELPVLIVDNEIRESRCTGISFFGPCIIEHNLIVSNGEGGILITGNVTINHNIIASNGGHGLSCGSRNNQKTCPAVHYNNIFDNGEKGINYISPVGHLTINATENYWGSPDGPSGYGPGNGDEVDQCVLYEPWSSEMNENAGPRP
jgi:nitrous oxidase accessory protein NosD